MEFSKKLQKRAAKRRIEKRNQALEKVGEWGILGLLVFSPLPAASVYGWSVLVIELAVFLMVGAYLWTKQKPQNNELLSKSLEVPSFMFWGFFLFLLLQAVPLPKFLVKIFSPKTFSFYSRFSPDFSSTHFLSLSVVPSETLRQGFEIAMYVILGFLVLRVVRTKSQIMRLFGVIVGVGVFEAVYGLFELLRAHPRVLYYEKQHFLDQLTGSFINPNHLSGYLEMAVPVGVGLLLARIGFFDWSGWRFKEKILWIKESGWVKNGLLFLGIVVMVLGIISSGSRTGGFILVLSAVLFAGLSGFYYHGLIEEKNWIKTALKVIFGLVVVFCLIAGISRALKRFSEDEVLQAQRPEVWGNTLEMLGDFPVFGAGLGTFGEVYSAYEESEEFVRHSHAYNDYLEYGAELGILGMVLLFGGIFFMLVSAFWVWRERRHPQIKGLALGGIVALGVALVHGFMDFSLHIPANKVLFSVVLALTVKSAFYMGKK